MPQPNLSPAIHLAHRIAFATNSSAPLENPAIPSSIGTPTGIAATTRGLPSHSPRANPPTFAGALLAIAGIASLPALADPPPCPPLVEVPCDAGGGSGGEPPIAQPCTPGPGGWTRTPLEITCVPEQPIDLREQFTFGLTRWNSAVHARARPTVASCMVSLSGQSIFLGTGSQSLGTSASFQRTSRETWSGEGPAAPRIVQLVANGFAGLSIAVTCGPSQGCSATASAGAAGGCHSLGDASASLEPKAIGGTARYDSVESAVRVQGDLGIAVDDSGPSMTGDVSSEVSWTLDGIGAASGSASYVVRPDRTYCAYTNRPIVRRAYAAMTTAVAVTVDAGAAAAVGVATAGFSVD